MSSPDHQVGASVGRYVVRAEIGRGGMGRVLRAHDPKLAREVALKEVRREVLGHAGTQRLVSEARAMAKLAHPNVVAVYDVLTVSPDRVVLVMEYVPGRSLSQWLREPRGWQEIVGCYRQAGRGLAAAHAAGLLHRDFKPDNVLVGDDGRVRVTDFGLAREIVLASTDGSSVDLEASQATGHGTVPGTIAGTLPYLAPERLMGSPADTATDQFAFCVSLWEALFGQRPFTGHSIGELAFWMSAGPPRPPADAPRVPGSLVRAVIRGLATDPRARWPSMHELVDAIGTSPSARRRRWRHAGLGAVALVLCAGAVQTWAAGDPGRCTEDSAAAHLEGTWDDVGRDTVRDGLSNSGATHADDAWTTIEPALDTYASAWTRMHMEACEATAIQGEQPAAVLDLRMACLHRARVELVAVTRALAHADTKTVQNAHALAASLPPLERCADLDALRAAVEPPLPEQADGVDEARTLLARARAALTTGHHDDAEHAVDTAEARMAAVDYRPLRAEVALVRGLVLDAQGRYESAREELREALRLASTSRHPEALRAAATHLIYVVGYRLQQFDEALRYADVARGAGGSDTQHEADLSTMLGFVLGAQGKHAQAQAQHRRALELEEEAHGPDHIRVAIVRNNLANALHAQGEHEAAEAEHRRVLAWREHTLGADHPDLAASRNNLAVALEAQGKYAEAETHHREALATRQKVLGRRHPEVGTSRSNLANVLDAQGKHAEAEAEHRRAIALWESTLGPEHPNVATAHANLALALERQGKHAAAEVEHRRATALLEAALGPGHVHVAVSRHNLAGVLHAQGNHEEAETEHRASLQVLETALPPDHPHLAAARTALADVLLARDAVHEARALAQSAWARAQRDDVPPVLRAETAFVLARASWAEAPQQVQQRAIELAERAAGDYAVAGEGHALDAAEVEAWLHDHRRPAVDSR